MGRRAYKGARVRLRAGREGGEGHLLWRGVGQYDLEDRVPVARSGRGSITIPVQWCLQNCKSGRMERPRSLRGGSRSSPPPHRRWWSMMTYSRVLMFNCIKAFVITRERNRVVSYAIINRVSITRSYSRRHHNFATRTFSKIQGATTIFRPALGLRITQLVRIK